MDAERVRTYTSGGYSLGQIDTDAHSRVVYGKCRGPFLQNEKSLTSRLVARTGGLGGIGLARATRPDRTLKPSEPPSFLVFSSRSKLEPPWARFGVVLANALPQAEKYWNGAITLTAGSDTKSDWGSAAAWLRDGRVARVLVNVQSGSKLGDLPKALALVYGAPGTTSGTVTTWSLPGGVVAKLDIGAAAALVVEQAGVVPAAVAPSTSAAPAASVR